MSNHHKRHAPARTLGGSASTETPQADSHTPSDAPKQAPTPPQRRDGLSITHLNDLNIQKLTQIAKDMNVGGATVMRKQDLIFQVLKAQTDQSGAASFFPRACSKCCPTASAFCG